MRILIVAGGTGGHIVPGMALASAMRELGARTEFLTLNRNREYAGLSESVDALHTYDAPPLQKSITALLRFPFRLFGAYRYARRLVTKFDALVCMGGYPTLPAVIAARSRRIPFFLCEQNVVPGKITRRYGKDARAIYANYPMVPEPLANEVVISGNPLRPALREAVEKSHRRRRQKPDTLLVLGGSQGARQINEMLPTLLETVAFKKVYFQCGAQNLEQMKSSLSPSLQKKVELFGYRSDLDALFVSADIFLGRAGAGVTCEAAAFGLPMVLIPYPYAADNHQLANARYFERNGAAIVINQDDTDAGELVRAFQELGRNPERLRQMSEAARGMGKPDASQTIARDVLTRLNRMRSFQSINQTQEA